MSMFFFVPRTLTAADTLQIELYIYRSGGCGQKTGLLTSWQEAAWKGTTFLGGFLEERLPEFNRAFVTQLPMNSFVVKSINIGHQFGL